MHVLYRREERQNGEKWDREESRGETRNKDERENMLTCNALVQLRKSKQSNQRRRKKEEEEKVQERTNAEKKNRTRIRIRIIRMDNKQTLLKLKVEKKKKVYNNKIIKKKNKRTSVALFFFPLSATRPFFKQIVWKSPREREKEREESV